MQIGIDIVLETDKIYISSGMETRKQLADLVLRRADPQRGGAFTGSAADIDPSVIG